MNVCKFTFISLRTSLPCNVFGIERSWDYLKQEFNRTGDELHGARYFETIGPGPILFATVGDVIYYNFSDRWIPYASAVNVSFEIMDTN